MEPKVVIILLVVVSFVRGSYVPKLTVSYGLSDKQVAVLNTIVVDQEAAVSAYANAVNDLFKVFNNTQADTNEMQTDLSKALVKLNKAIGTSWKSVSAPLGKSCSASEVVQNRARGYLDDAAAQTTAALKLAVSGNYFGIRDKIENYQTAARQDYTNFVQDLFDSIRSCQNTTDDKVEEVIADAQEGSLSGHVRITNSVFNAIKVVAVMATVGHPNKLVISNTHDFKIKASAGVYTHEAYLFSIIKTLYINTVTKKSILLRGSALNQYALIASFNQYRAAYSSFFQLIGNYLKRIAFRIYDDSITDYFKSETDFDKVIAEFKDAVSDALDSILVLDPHQSFDPDLRRAELDTVNNEGDTTSVNAMNWAVTPGSNYSEVLERIEDMRNVAVSAVGDRTNLTFLYIRNNVTWDKNTEAKLTTLKKQADDGATVALNKAFDAVVILSDAAHKGETLPNDFSTFKDLDDLHDGALIAIESYLQAFSAAGFTVLKAAFAD